MLGLSGKSTLSSKLLPQLGITHSGTRQEMRVSTRHQPSTCSLVLAVYMEIVLELTCWELVFALASFFSFSLSLLLILCAHAVPGTCMSDVTHVPGFACASD